ncbi:hypothetical protein HWV62_23516 [Athelia sp. TMB]|nr:hypothetical protein HWV62_23516 [Athelia sp. TMB]
MASKEHDSIPLNTSTSFTNASGPLILRISTNQTAAHTPPPQQTNTPADAQPSSTTPGLPPPTHPPRPFIPLISAPLSHFEHFAQAEHSQWLIDVAHDICDPAHRSGTLRRLESPSYADCTRGPSQTWAPVRPAEPLRAALYEYVCGRPLTLSQISRREGKSKSSRGGYAEAMRRGVLRRDGYQCWLSREHDDDAGRFVSSHIIPKRMGGDVSAVLLARFSRPGEALIPPTGIYDPMYGITLTRQLDCFFADYTMGLRRIDDASTQSEPSWRVFTISLERLMAGPLLQTHVHGRLITPPNLHSDTQADIPRPPPAAFRWHYLQCVLRRFATPEYIAIANIHHHEMALRMEGDSDDEDEVDSNDDLWPSAVIDYGAYEAERERGYRETTESVGRWVESIPGAV